MSQMFVHCGYCGIRFYLASPCNHIHKVLDWPTCSSCSDRFKVFPRLPEVLQDMKDFRKEWIEGHADWIGKLGCKYNYVFDGVTGHEVKDLVWRLACGFDVDIRLEGELDRRINKARDKEIFRRLRKKYRGTSLTLDGVRVIVRDLNYENVATVSNTMAYWGGSDEWYRWLRDKLESKCLVVRHKGRVIGYICQRQEEWAATTDLDIVWWAWTKRSSRDDAVRVLLATTELISLEGNEECQEAIWKKQRVSGAS